MENVRVRVGDRSMGGIHRHKRGLATGTATERAPGQPSGPWPQRPYGRRAHSADPTDARLAAGWKNGRCVRCSTGIPLRDVEALHLSGGDGCQNPALQRWQTATRTGAPTPWRRNSGWLHGARQFQLVFSRSVPQDRITAPL